MKNQVLSIEQMRELEALGIDTSKASIFWVVNVKNEKGKEKDLIPPFLSFHKTTQKVGMQRFECVPTFTLQDILELLPGTINDFTRVIYPGEITYEYEYEAGPDIPYETLHCEWFRSGDNGVLLAFFEMLKWCKQNNYVH